MPKFKVHVFEEVRQSFIVHVLLTGKYAGGRA